MHASQTLPPLLPQRIPLRPEVDGSSQVDIQNDDHENGAISHISTDSQPSPTSLAIGSLHATSLAFLLPSRSAAVIWRGPKKTAMVRQFLSDVLWPPLDYLLIDTPPGTSDEHISLAETLLKHTITTTTTIPNHLAGAVIVTTPQAVATADVKKEINFCRKTNIPVVGVVENMSGFVCECCGERTNLFGKGGGEVMCREFGERFLGSVPLDLGWGVVVEEGGWAQYGEASSSKNGDGTIREEQGGMAVNGHGGGVQRDDREDDGRLRRKGEALLVQRYRSCKLCDVFEGITRQITNTVEDGQE